jgi:drug/metabolite transporter (DMT)-like permease
MPRAPDLLVVFAIAFVSLGALLAMGRLTSASRLSRSAPMAYLQIPFAMGIGWSFDQQLPDWRSSGGLLVVLLSVLLAWRWAARVAHEPAHDSGLIRLESRL